MISKRYFIKKAQDQAPVGVEDSGSNNTSEQGASVSVVENDPELNAASNENNVKHNELIIFEQGKAINKGMSLPPGKYWVIRKLNPDVDPFSRDHHKGTRGYAREGSIAVGTDSSNSKHYLIPHYVSLDESGNFSLKPLRERPYEKDKYVKGPAVLTKDEIERLLQVVPAREQEHWEKYLESLTEGQKRRLTGGERSWLSDLFGGSNKQIDRREQNARSQIEKYYSDKSILESLTKIANELDKKGLTKEASLIDQIVFGSISQKG